MLEVFSCGMRKLLETRITFYPYPTRKEVKAMSVKRGMTLEWMIGNQCVLRTNGYTINFDAPPAIAPQAPFRIKLPSIHRLGQG